MKRLSLVVLTVCTATTLGFAQGTDACTTPTAIAGLGTFAFNNTAATTGTQGQTEALCNQNGSIAVRKDVWFAWTSPSTDSYDLSTCGLAGFDSKLAVYAGNTCPAASALACSDDSCGTQSLLTFPASLGSVYAFQVGSFGNTGGAGSIAVSVHVPCSASTGADVIVGDLGEISNYVGANNLDAVSFGTTSCNIGTAPLGWYAGTTNHPVIGGNLYRYRVTSGAGRFEQIGMSWLKHGFYALSGTLCCADCVGTNGDTLGVSCSDPYTSDRNGTQSGLGPRFQVNAHTGAFTFPPANPAWSGTMPRRCEYATSDIDQTAGVRYFGESQYVTPDDSAANNQNNNASYRELSLVGATTDFAFLTATQRAQSAIRAWRVCDPSVVLTDVQIPNDGLFVVGYRTTSLGGGQYHYEYAVYNMNADRNGGSFSVPIPASATITNVGFHDIAYRDGDGSGNVNVAGTDWTVTQTANSISWACEAVGANVNANALRWGTTYNFRFDANAAPTLATATLGLWKTGSPANIGVNVEVPTGATSYVYCAGDGSVTACPCANNSAAGAGVGCLNSTALGGKLRATGSASISSDTLTLTGTQIPDGPGLFFQGTTQVNAVFGNGLQCAGGTTTRLGIAFASGNTSSYPAGASAVHLAGATSAGQVRNYQLWFRDTPGICVAAGFNLSNGVSLTWIP